jgi:DNA repair protein RecO (recombination protein O)
MLITTKAVVLRTIRHGDNKVVLKAWTQHAGLRSYLLRTGKRGVSQAALQPLNRVELVADEHPEREMHMVRELRVERPYERLPYDPVRGALALFVQEVLYKALRVESADEDLHAFVEEVLETMDTAPDIRHFPLLFLVRLSGHLGFYPEAPDPAIAAGMADHFDLREGHFLPGGAPHGHTMGPPLSTALARLLGEGLDDLPGPPIEAAVRRSLLDHLLLYFRLHVEGFGELRSPAVLHQVLN